MIYIAYLSATGGIGVINWSVIGLSNPFNTTYYIEVGITTSNFSDGTYTRPSGILDYVSAPSSGSATSVSSSCSASVGTYTIYGYARSPYDDKYWKAGSATVTVTGSGRPSNWVWSPTIVQGGDVNITASSWNNFTSRINAFRTYKTLSAYTFTTAVAGNDITATIVNQARTAINAMSPSTAVPSATSSGGTFVASFFNGLRDSLNSIT